ncbi:MAG: hypothetical protein V3T77_09795 [Planctomycetota bacterium]
MMRPTLLVGFVSLILVVFLGVPGFAGSHSWRINEIFSNADGTVQFIEMKECCGFGSEILIGGKYVRSDIAGNEFIFADNLTENTANRHLLLATPAFAALPGAPTPDYTIDPSFFALMADTIRYWTYPLAVLTFGAGDLPTDGVMSLNGDGTTGSNSPTNFAGESGMVDASGGGMDSDFARGDGNGDGTVNVADPVYNLNYQFNMGPATCLDALDSNDDGTVNVADPVYSLGFQFAMGPALPPPNECGSDPSDDTLDCQSYSSCP